MRGPNREAEGVGPRASAPGSGLPQGRHLRIAAKHSGINYRLLYFFHERAAVVLSHGIMKQAAEVPAKEIELAIRRKRRFAAAPNEHTYEENQ